MCGAQRQRPRQRWVYQVEDLPRRSSVFSGLPDSIDRKACRMVTSPDSGRRSVVVIALPQTLARVVPSTTVNGFWCRCVCRRQTREVDGWCEGGNVGERAVHKGPPRRDICALHAPDWGGRAQESAEGWADKSVGPVPSLLPGASPSLLFRLPPAAPSDLPQTTPSPPRGHA